MDREFSLHAAGVGFHCSQRGAAPRAVFVHGFGCDLQTWDPLWAACAEHELPALRYDLRGYGQSHAPQPAAFDHAEDLLAILDAAQIAQCDLVGVSMGGGIALNFALDHPQRLRSLVLISPGLVAWEWSENWRRLWRPIVASARGGALQQARQLWWQHPLFASTRDSAGAVALHDSIMRFSGEQWIRDDHRPMLPDVERLHRLQTRTLLLSGGRDFEDFRLIADLIEASASNLQRIDDPQRGHLLHLEDAAVCAQRMLAFLQAAG
jgi:pimeloyl-ACP methyl ester carboxylesterase